MKIIANILMVILPVVSTFGQKIDSLHAAAFMDGLITTKMKDEKIAGASVAIVQDGKVLLAKGYGFSDVKAQTPVDAATTQFRIGSVSKLFVWTAIMRLVAEGKLDLDADINTYMKDVMVPEKYDQPVTLRHLLTHTPGFEDHVLNLFGRDSSSLRPLGELLRDQMPERVRPPFTHASYSNHGTGMAAYIVEKISGMTFLEYVEKNITGPLNMQYTTFRQPIPKAFPGTMSKGYQVMNNEFIEQPFEYVPLYPVGAAASTALDMTHLMMAFLQNGTYDGYVLLDSATLAFMQSPAHRHHPAVNPMRYGFMDLSQNGETLIGHGGDTFWFHTAFLFLPEHNAGLFVSFNTDKGGGAYLDVVESFMDEYFPDRQVLAPSIDVDDDWLRRFEGEYMVNRYPHDDLFKVSNLGGRFQIKASDQKLKVISNSETTVYVPIDSNTFREEFKSDVIAFEIDKTGNVQHGFLGLLPIFALDKVGGLDLSSFHISIMVIIVITMLVTLAYWPLVRRIRKGYRLDHQSSLALPATARRVAWLNYFCLLLFIVFFVAGISNPLDLVYGIPGVVRLSLFIAILMVPLTLWMIFSLVKLIANASFKLRSRIFYLIITLVSIAALWQLNYWNLLGFNY